MNEDVKVMTDAHIRRSRYGMNTSFTVAIILLIAALIRAAIFGGWGAAREPLILAIVLLAFAEAVAYLGTVWVTNKARRE